MPGPANLDTDLRAEMRVEIARLHEELGTTMVYVTHDQIEAMTLADRIVVLNEGRIEQIGTPQELYRQPANQFVAGFIGSPRMNFVAGALLGEKARGATTLGVRPEAIRLVPAEEAHVSGTLLRLEDLGHEHLAYVEIARDITWTVRLAAHPDRERGAMVGLGWAEEALYRFGTDGRAVA